MLLFKEYLWGIDVFPDKDNSIWWQRESKGLIVGKSKGDSFLFSSLTTTIGQLGTSRLIVMAHLIKWKNFGNKTTDRGLNLFGLF